MPPSNVRWARRALPALAVVLVAVLGVVARPGTAAAPVEDPPVTTPAQVVQADTTPAVETQVAPGTVGSASSVTLSIPGAEEPSQSVVIIVLLTLLSVAPALLVLLTSFTRIAIVLS